MVLNAFGKLIAGNVAVQVITLLFYPILGRIYTPADFGMLGVVSSLSVVLSIFASGQLHFAFPQLEENSQDSRRLLKLSFLYTLCCVLLIFILSMAGVFNFLFQHSSLYISLLIPIFTLAYASSEIMKMWLVHLRKYTVNSIVVSSNRLLSNCLKVLAPKSIGLIHSEVISNFMAVIVALKASKVSFRGLGEVRSLLKKYYYYPLFFTFGSLAQSLQQELPVFMFKRFFDSDTVGLYVLANKFTVQSVLLVSNSLILVLANKKDQNTLSRIKNELKTIFKFTFPLALLIFVFLSIFGEKFFLMFLGHKWHGVGEISAYLSLLLFPKMIFIPLHAEILRSGRVKLITILRLIQILGAISLFLVLSGYEFSFVLKGYVIYDFCSDIIISVICYKLITNQEKGKSHVPS